MKTTIIGIAGGTASGKTTIAKKLYESTASTGTVALIRLDDYYKDAADLSMEERRKINFDHPDSYDSKLLISHLNKLKRGEAIEKPTYDFVNYVRSNITETIEPCDIIIVEGIMLFAIPELRKMFQMKIYVDTADDVRFIRRLRRDIENRGRTLESVVNQYMATVRPMHETFVEPSKRYADIIVPEGGKNMIAVDVLVTKMLDLINHKEKASLPPYNLYDEDGNSK